MTTGMTLKTITSPERMYQWVSRAVLEGRKVGVVPTMGALHEGHLSLVDAAKAECDLVVATIFVNPTQFAAGEDLDQYPRPLKNDLRHLKEGGASIAFCPAMEEIYPPGYSTYVSPPEIAAPFEGLHRPDHFRGVATIVLKLFQMVPAQVAFFGQKDYQQTLVVKKMVEDFNLPIEIRVCPILREPDGLAMSSRNVFLSDEQRGRAVAISKVLAEIEPEILRLTDHSSALKNRLTGVMETARKRLEVKVDKIHYLEVVDAQTLQSISDTTTEVVIVAAADVGDTRLLDNRLVKIR